MGENNGKWQIAFWVLTVLVIASFTWTTWCYFRNDNKIISLKEISNDCLHKIDKRLSRIETKMGIEFKE